MPALILCMFSAVTAMADEAERTGFTVEIGPNPETLDPALNFSVCDANMLILLDEPLTIIDENQRVQPGQAESWTVSEDGLIWTFTMRDGLKWSDGTELNAKDFEYSFKRFCDPEVGAIYSDTILYMVAGFDEAMNGDLDALQVVASEDSRTLTVTLTEPCAYFDRLAAFVTLCPVQRATVEANGDAWALSPETFVCNGPYMISEWIPDERIVCVKNPCYRGGWDPERIVTDEITFLLSDDYDAVYAAYRSGEAAMIRDFPFEEISGFTKAEDGGDFHRDAILGTYYLTVNCAAAPFDDANVRKALNLAFDREYAANVIMEGSHIPAYNLVGTGVTDYEGFFMDNAIAANNGETYISQDFEANLAAAKRALADAGYPNGEGFPVITYCTNDSGYHVPLAEYLQTCYADMGITMDINVMDMHSFMSQCRRTGEFGIARSGWVMDYNDPFSLMTTHESTDSNNDGNYSNPAFDAAIDASRTADAQEHFRALHDAETILAADYACIPVAYYADVWLQNPALRGTWHSPYGY